MWKANERPEHRSLDCVFIGTGIISILEAVCQCRSGKRVLMVDAQPKIGGVWACLELFGLHEVENAIHYFQWHPAGLAFMQAVLNWNVTVTAKKYRIFPPALWAVQRVGYRNPLGLALDRLTECYSRRGGLLDYFDALRRAVRDAPAVIGRPYHYLPGGTPVMMRTMQALLESAPVEVLLATRVEGIHLDRAVQSVRLATSKGELQARQVCITHGSKLTEITCEAGRVPIRQEAYRRPHVHLLVRDSSPQSAFECVFVADTLIKYVHDVTRFTREADELADSMKLLVVATKHECQEGTWLYDELIRRLKAVGIIALDAELLGHYWQETYLPALSTAELRRLGEQFSPLIMALESNPFCESIGLHSERWRAALSERPVHGYRNVGCRPAASLHAG